MSKTGRVVSRSNEARGGILDGPWAAARRSTSTVLVSFFLKSMYGEGPSLSLFKDMQVVIHLCCFGETVSVGAVVRFR